MDQDKSVYPIYSVIFGKDLQTFESNNPKKIISLRCKKQLSKFGMAFCVSRMRESAKIHAVYFDLCVCPHTILYFLQVCKYVQLFEAKPGSLKLRDVKNIEFKHGKLALNQTLTLKHFALFQQLNFWKEHHHHHGLLSTLPP